MRMAAEKTEEKRRARAWRQKSEAGFLAAYDQHADAIFRHVLLRVRDRDAATDIVQETFSRAWLYLSQGKHIEYMRAFLYRIANNLIVDASRKKRTSSLDVMMENDGFEPRDEMAKDPAEIPQAREAVALLKSLDETYRVAITMRFIEELSPKEIARKLGVSENVVSVRIHRGIARLGKLMNGTNAETA
jgi:RNA polymerase sigma factor (sigma-70 family)